MTSPRRLPRKRSSQSPAAALWIAARARNALRRPAFISSIGLLTFVASLLALAIVPQQARKAAAALRPAATLRPDTEPTLAALKEAERQAVVADSVLVNARTELAHLVSAAADSQIAHPPLEGTQSRRDSLASQVALLSRLIARSENAPLLGSYRAMAQSAPLQGDVRVRALLDSLVEIERERDSYSAVGGVDPVFVALTARANELGRNIAALADGKRLALKAILDGSAPSTLVANATPRALPDTLDAARLRTNAHTAAAGVATRLQRERAELLKLDDREERANELSNVGASPAALLAAALVFGAALGFGIALFMEVRQPRIADAYEAQRAAGVRVLAEIRPVPVPQSLDRREAERTGSRYLDPGSDGHQLIYLTIATAGTNTVMLTVTGDNASVASIVAINFAAIAADEARSTLLVDADGVTSGVTAALCSRPSAGVSGLATGSHTWQEVTRTARLGPDRTIDMVPSGEGVVAIEKLKAVLAQDAATLTRRYDAIVIAASQDQVRSGLSTALPIPDVVYCVRAGQTSIRQLKLAMHEIAESGSRVRGLVLWAAPDPVLGELRPVEDAERDDGEQRR